MMDNPHSSSGAGEDNVGFADDLRCKRSDGKQWRCTAMSMPDKTVCEKHYIQAKKRAANSAMRASIKKSKRKSIGESDIYLESKSDDMDLPLSSQFTELSGSVSRKNKKEKLLKGHAHYSPEFASERNFSSRNSRKITDDADLDGSEHEESRRSYRTPPRSVMDSSRIRSRKTFEASPAAETSDESLDSSDDTMVQPCHQCQCDDRDIIWCLKCDRRGYCESCISTWYSGIPVEEIQRVCPACQGTCSCRICLQGDNLIKARIREIPAKEKLQYLYCLLSAVLPVVKQIHSEQCSEVELEKGLQGNKIDLVRTKINADEQMCCDSCRIPIIDYHRHCTNCSYDLCLNCCKDIRKASKPIEKLENQISVESDDQDGAVASANVKLSDAKFYSFRKYHDWKANADGSIPCPLKEQRGCGSSLLTLKRIFKMNWVAKLVKNVEELVNGCKIHNSDCTKKIELDHRIWQAAHRENKNDSFLYHPSAQDVKNGGIGNFRMQWSSGKPVIIKEILETSALSIWDPMAIWRGIKETTEEKVKDVNRVVKAVDCFDCSEINIELEDFMKGYFHGRIHESGRPQLLKLKDWPSPSASEEFLLCQRSDFINKLPLLEFIHSKWGVLNVAAKLPHYSLQNDVGPRISISYGLDEEIGLGDSTSNLHLNIRDMVFLLLHTCKVELESKQAKFTKKTNYGGRSDEESCSSYEINLKPYDGENGPTAVFHSNDTEKMDDQEIKRNSDGENGPTTVFYSNDTEKMDDQEIEGSYVVTEAAVNFLEDKPKGIDFDNAQTGALWDVFRRQDVPQLIEYIKTHWKEFGKFDNIINDNVSWPLYDGAIYLNRHHRGRLKEQFGVEPWSFKQHIGEAIFIPAGCPFQARNIQSSVQLGLDFLSPESLPEAVRLSEEIRGLPNYHSAKFQMLEVGKISLYAASSAIREVQKLVLDPKLGLELGFEDPNLTVLVLKNLENMVKQRQVTCS